LGCENIHCCFRNDWCPSPLITWSTLGLLFSFKVMLPSFCSLICD
jgi:hypothetical protein